MTQECYISATSTTHQDRANEIIGPCGPCSWINLLGLKGSFDLEKELAEIGRLKPFYASTFVSYLLWAEKYGVDVIVYVDSTEISQGMFNMMFSYENIPKEERDLMRKQAIDLVRSVVKRNKNKIHLLETAPIQCIDALLDQDFLVAFNIAATFPDYDKLIGHLRVCVGKENGRYVILDSYFGKITRTREEMIQDIANVDILGGTHEIVGYKKIIS